jgi:hypothetical protein
VAVEDLPKGPKRPRRTLAPRAPWSVRAVRGPALAIFGGVIANLPSDDDNCGACGVMCSAGTQCLGSRCVCPVPGGHGGF